MHSSSHRTSIACFLLVGLIVWSVSAGEPEVLKPKIETSAVFPNPPRVWKAMDKGVLGKDTPWFWDSPEMERGKTQFEPVADGFTRHNGTTQPLVAGNVHHWLVYQNNQVHVGDRPVANVRLLVASDMYGLFDTFPITGIGKDVSLKRGTAVASLGAVRFAMEANGKTQWLDCFPDIQVTYRAGEAQWHCVDPGLGVDLTLRIRPNITARGLIAQIEATSAPKGARLISFFGCVGLSCWPYNNFAYDGDAAPRNEPAAIELSGAGGKLTTPTLPRAQTYFGVSGDAKAAIAPERVFDIAAEKPVPDRESNEPAKRQCIRVDSELVSGKPLYAIAVWGADGYDEAKMLDVKKKMKPEALAAPEYDKVWKTWFDNFIGMQLEPQQKFERLQGDPGKAWAEAEGFWRDRSRRWNVATPDPLLNASVNWTGQTLEYFRQPPGYMLGQIMWCGWGHMTSGWDALGTMGDDENLEMLVGVHAATRDKPTPIGGDPKKDPLGKEIKWVFLNLDSTVSEPMNAPWLYHVWTWWQWTGDNESLRALWPAVQDAIQGEMAARDPDGDGLYHGFYEFWDCDREQRGPKAAGETAWMIADLRGAAVMADALGKKEEAEYFRVQAEKSEKAFQSQLWHPETGQSGARTADDQRYERASVQEIFLPTLKGVLTEKQAAQGFRRLHHLYSQTSRFGLPMMFKNDCWPVFWSQHYMPPGDISTTYIGAAKCGLAAEYFPFYEMISHAPLKSHHGGFGLSIGNDGSTDAQQTGNMDAQSPFALAAAEGLFGISPDGRPGHVRIAPNLPEKWPTASCSFGEITVEMKREGTNRVDLKVTDAKHRRLRIQWPTTRPVTQVLLDGKPTPFHLVPAVNRALIETEIEAKQPLQLAYEFLPEPVSMLPNRADVISGVAEELKATGGKIVEVDDPQKCLAGAKIAADGASLTVTPQSDGFHTIFVRLESGSLCYWSAVSFTAGPAWQIVNDFQASDPPRTAPIRQDWPKLDCATKTLTVRLRNRQSSPLKGVARVTVAGQTTERAVEIPADGVQDVAVGMSEDAWRRLLPGSVPFDVELGGRSESSKVVVWPTTNPDGPKSPSADRLVLLDIDAARNLTAPKMEKTPMPLDFDPPRSVNTLLGWYNTPFTMNALPSRFEPIPGLPMAMSGLAQKPEGEPMLVLSYAGSKEKPAPTRARFEIGRKVERAYVLNVFQFYTIKCYAPHAQWTLTYDDGSQQTVSWIPPYDVNGHQRPESPWSLPVTAVGQFTQDYSKHGSHSFGPFHAQLVDIPIDPSKTLVSMEADVTQTEAFMAILGITLVKPAGE